MKKIITILTLLIASATAGQSQTKKVLFLGDSYTSVNNLPQMIADVALSAGNTLIFDSNTPGGYKLEQHVTNITSQNKIMAGGWDYVVLQEQSQTPITNENLFADGVRDLVGLTKQYNPCAVPMLYMTWGRKNGDALNCLNIPLTCTYNGMDSLLRITYLQEALFYRTEVSPVGAVWKYIRNNYPSIDLYQADKSHPSIAGSYAAACCFYSAIFKKDPTLITYNYGLSTYESSSIRNAVKAIVFDSLATWDFKQMPTSDFTYIIGGGVNEVIFTNKMKNADTYLWDFGDGTTSSTSVNPTHNYLSNGTYTITLTASNCDLSGTHQATHQINISFCTHTPTLDSLMLCPHTSDTLWTQAADSYQWYDTFGTPLAGKTNQYLLVSVDSLGNYPLINGGTYYSVLTTNSGCSEMSQQAFAGRIEWPWGTYGFIQTIGNLIHPDTACLQDTLKLILMGPPYNNHNTQWFNNGMLIPSANSDTLIVTLSGTYKAEYSHPLCSNIIYQSDTVHYTFINCIIGIPENTKDSGFNVYPNPGTETITINFTNRSNKESIQIYNSIGVLVKKVEISQSTQINISDFSNGLYFIHLEINTPLTYKFMKQ